MIDFHKIAGIVEIAGYARSLQSLCFDFHIITGIAVIVAIAALVFSIKSLRSLTIRHDHYDRGDSTLVLSQRSLAVDKENFVSI